MAASTPIMDRLERTFQSAASGVGSFSQPAARQIVFAVLAELVQAADELDEDRLQPMSGREASQQLDRLVAAFNEDPSSTFPADRVRAGLTRVLSHLLGEPRAVSVTILGKSGWQETALRALLEEAQRQLAVGPPDTQQPPFSLDPLRDALWALTVVQGSREDAQDAVDRAARAISQVTKQHAADAVRTHRHVGQGL